MIDAYGRWYPDYPGQQMYQDPAYARAARTSSMPQAQPTIQQSGFVLVHSEQEARSYPVAPGNSITFKDESRPYCYVKTMGFNQLDGPRFEKYRLIKEDEPQKPVNQPQASGEGEVIEYVTKREFGALERVVEEIKSKVGGKDEIKSKVGGGDNE